MTMPKFGPFAWVIECNDGKTTLFYGAKRPLGFDTWPNTKVVASDNQQQMQNHVAVEYEAVHRFINSVLRSEPALVPSQYPATIPMMSSTAVTICVFRLPSYPSG